jgi:hypothetical protein
VTVALDKEGYAENEPVKITAQVFNEVYEPVNDASVWAQVTGPTGESQAIPLEWTFGEGGTYRAEYHPSIGGMYRVDVSVRAPEAIAASDQAGFSVKTSVAEFTDATLHADALRQLAGTTGGTYTPLNRVATLPEQIPPVKQSSSTTRERDLRDTPLIFAAILLFLGAEWFLRRQKGLA